MQHRRGVTRVRPLWGKRQAFGTSIGLTLYNGRHRFFTVAGTVTLTVPAVVKELFALPAGATSSHGRSIGGLLPCSDPRKR
jgi:hypothetical protein